MFLRQNELLELDTELEFGKHQGLSVSDILEDDPQYIEWLKGEGYEVSDEVQDELNDARD